MRLLNANINMYLNLELAYPGVLVMAGESSQYKFSAVKRQLFKFKCKTILFALSNHRDCYCPVSRIVAPAVMPNIT
jgi:hypothetical protein